MSGISKSIGISYPAYLIRKGLDYIKKDSEDGRRLSETERYKLTPKGYSEYLEEQRKERVAQAETDRRLEAQKAKRERDYLESISKGPSLLKQTHINTLI